MTLKPRSMRVALRVLGTVQSRAGLGWSWSCNHKGCLGHGIRVDRTAAEDAVAAHWQERHGATGGGQG